MLIVEDGSALEDAEVYLTVAEADEYHLKRGNAEWAELALADKEAALRKGSDFMLQTYRARWDGLRTSATQALDWPRSYVERDASNDTSLLDRSLPSTSRIFYPENFIPKEIKFANAELALRSLDGDLNIDTERLTTDEQVGSIKVSYDRGATDKRRFPVVEGYLRPFLKAGGAGRLVRG